MKRLTSLRITDYTTAQIQQLRARIGANQTEIVALAIDRMYRQEFGNGINPMQQETQTMNEQITIADGTYTPEQLARLVAEASERGDWYDGENGTNILDWITEGDYSGDETIASLAAEWDA